jgi:protein gp37
MDRFHLESGNRLHENQPGCRHCYAERMAKRFHAMGQPNYKQGIQVSLHDRAIVLPLTWKKPQTIFVNSMSDIFHEDVPEAFIDRVFDTMRKAPWHIFQVLTKRAERLEAIGRSLSCLIEDFRLETNVARVQNGNCVSPF